MAAASSDSSGEKDSPASSSEGSQVRCTNTNDQPPPSAVQKMGAEGKRGAVEEEEEDEEEEEEDGDDEDDNEVEEDDEMGSDSAGGEEESCEQRSPDSSQGDVGKGDPKVESESSSSYSSDCKDQTRNRPESNGEQNGGGDGGGGGAGGGGCGGGGGAGGGSSSCGGRGVSEGGGQRRASMEMSSSDGEPLSRMDSEDSISSTLMDQDSIISSGRSTPAMMNGKSIAYTCCWDQCHACFNSSPDLAEHIRSVHVDGQRGGVFVCLWKGCKVYNTPSTSQSWLQRHMLTHSGDKPFKCVVGGCNASFASQGGLARHVPTHFSQQNSSKVSNPPKVKEESPSKAGMNKRRRLKNKRRRSLPRPHDFFDAQIMDAIRHRAICLNLATHIESLGNGHSVVFHSTIIARRKEESGKIKVLLHWTPEDILPDVWVNENDRPQLKTKVVHLSKLPQDTAVLLDPNIYRTMPQKRLKRRMFF
ncbi:zinc finger protein AEBP2 [Erpetoichthys calabaricus]|uniref:Zinc finger protein AEBP2 n=1 Tax=Erpetoichthys calabaricus TaxID=27687 RepID=A0A8C4RGI9_ERPCA|nr:zinc finger protein AEBP2 [Erpetoichthys calabaricus]